MSDAAIDVVGKEAARLSIVEVGLGSILHGFHVPLAGQCLSLNQGLLLTRAVRKTRSLPGARGIGFSISGIAAVLKSLSPAGKKLTPMLAISAQGLLFSIGTTIFGPNLLGVAAGSLLLSVWAFLQPLLIYYFLFGQPLIEVLHKLFKKLMEELPIHNPHVLRIFLGVILLKMILSVILAYLGWTLSEARLQAYDDKLLAAAKARRPKRFVAVGAGVWAQSKAALRDLLNPLFVFSLLLTLIFYFYVEASASMMIWVLLRPLALGFAVFFVARMLPYSAWLSRLQGTPFEKHAQAFDKALSLLRDFKPLTDQGPT